MTVIKNWNWQSSVCKHAVYTFRKGHWKARDESCHSAHDSCSSWAKSKQNPNQLPSECCEWMRWTTRSWKNEQKIEAMCLFWAGLLSAMCSTSNQMLASRHSKHNCADLWNEKSHCKVSINFHYNFRTYGSIRNQGKDAILQWIRQFVKSNTPITAGSTCQRNM